MDGSVTVVVATRDRRDGVLATLGRHEGPVVLVDNASTDGTPEAVRRAFPAARVLTLPRNLGAAARNAGVEAARTPYVAFADDDSWWQPGALAAATRIFDAHPRLGLLAGRVLVGAAERTDPVSTLQARAPLGTAPGLPGPSVLGFLSCGAIVRREAFLRVGGFEPLLGIYGEEQLLAVDLMAAGWGVAYVPDVVACHHPAQGRAPARGRMRQQRRNDLLTLWLRRPGRVVLRRTARAAARAGRDADERAALLAAVRLLPAVRRLRRRLPAGVEHALALVEADAMAASASASAEAMAASASASAEASAASAAASADAAESAADSAARG